VVNIILWLVFGALVGWVANSIMRTDTQQDPLPNIGIGIAGAMIGGFLINYNTPNLLNLQNPLNLTALLVSFMGAVGLLGIVNLARRGTAR